MNFNEEFGTMWDGEEREIEGGDLIMYTSNEEICSYCEKKTHWVSVVFDDHVCSTECLNSMWTTHWR